MFVWFFSALIPNDSENPRVISSNPKLMIYLFTSAGTPLKEIRVRERKRKKKRGRDHSFIREIREIQELEGERRRRGIGRETERERKKERQG